jgi:hypothetical protein
MDAAGKLDGDILSGLFAQGFMGVTVEADYGGTQSSFAASCLVVEVWPLHMSANAQHGTSSRCWCPFRLLEAHSKSFNRE